MGKKLYSFQSLKYSAYRTVILCLELAIKFNFCANKKNIPTYRFCNCFMKFPRLGDSDDGAGPSGTIRLQRQRWLRPGELNIFTVNQFSVGWYLGTYLPAPMKQWSVPIHLNTLQIKTEVVPVSTCTEI